MLLLVIKFNGRRWAGVNIRSGQIKTRTLDIAVQQGKVNQGQLKVLQKIQKYGQGQGVNVNIHYIK